MFLLNKWIIFLLTCIYLTITKNFISWIYFFKRLNLSFIHMIKYSNFFFLVIYCHLSYLFFRWSLFITFPFLGHSQDFNSSYMVIIIKRIFGSVNTIRIIFMKGNTSTNDFIISVFVVLSSFLSDLFYSFDKTIMISIPIEADDSHSPINFYNLFPMR